MSFDGIQRAGEEREGRWEGEREKKKREREILKEQTESIKE